MTQRDRIGWLLTAINAVEDLVQPKLDARRREKARGGADGEHDQELEVCMEELRVSAEELTSMRDRLEFERQRYAELFDLAPEAYLETDSRWNIREANRAAAQLLRWHGCDHPDRRLRGTAAAPEGADQVDARHARPVRGRDGA